MFTGSGIPCDLPKLDGTIIDCYQVVTQMQDEDTIFTCNTYPHFVMLCLTKLSDRKVIMVYLPPICISITANHAGANAIVASAQARGIPVVSSKQMLDWLDGRNGSSFEYIIWNTDQLSFTVNVGAGALNLRGMIPVVSDVGTLLV